MYFLSAACLCSSGRVRLNNEDNFLFGQVILEEKHHSMEVPLTCRSFLYRPSFFAVFDGMGGEASGEVASHTAAGCARKLTAHAPARQDALRDFLQAACLEMNQAVFHRAEQLCVSRMGSTMAMLCLKGAYGHICNLGDSRIFRLRAGALEQLSKDHTDQLELEKRGIQRRPRLTQHLGIDPGEMTVEPYTATFPVRHKDIYLLCSDGLTDMLTEERIREVLMEKAPPAEYAQELVRQALDAGGKDNITVIVCKIQ